MKYFLITHLLMNHMYFSSESMSLVLLVMSPGLMPTKDSDI